MTGRRIPQVVAALAVVIFASTVEPATAHKVTQGRWMATTPRNGCTFLNGQVSHGVGTGLFKSETIATIFGWGTPCGWSNPKPAGDIRTSYNVYVYDWNGWRYCAGTGWYYNLPNNSSVKIETRTPYTPCGDGTYYSIDVNGYVWRSVSWAGGWFTVGDHYLPAVDGSGRLVPD